jgi:acetate kinase
VNVLVLNAGSSSLKFQVIATDPERMSADDDERPYRGAVEHFGPKATFQVEAHDGRSQECTAALSDMHAALDYILNWTSPSSSENSKISNRDTIDAVGHRVVHGGERFSESVLIDDPVLAAIEACIEIAPLHNPASVDGIRAARRFFGPGKPQVAVFDTAFHHTLPEHAFLYAIPYRLYDKYRVRRYGFHGTSHRYVAHRYRKLSDLRREQTNIISLHLGNGCSACAIKDGKSVDTSMGMTPLEGLVMGTRSGDVDPALVAFLAEKEGISAAEVEKLLNTHSGLLGISECSSDMRALSEAHSRKAQLATEIFCYRARKYVGAYLAVMGGADAIVFTGGIGENSIEIRAKICNGLQFAGLHISSERNEETTVADRKISTDASTLAAYCIHTDEELLIARDTVRCVLGLPHSS